MKPLSNETVGFIAFFFILMCFLTVVSVLGILSNDNRYKLCIENNMQYVEGSCIPKGGVDERK